MDSFDMENSNDSSDKVKEKVRVVSLEDPSIIASDFASNSNNSVWSLCGLNSDDHHVDLGDISPSISPIFSEQQMADHLRERLTAEENIFTGEGNDRVALSHDTKHLTDLKGDLELFDQEIKDFDHLDDATKDGAKNYSRFGQDDEESLAKIASKLSTNKRAQNRDTIFPPRTRTALRNRTRQRGQEESKKVLEKSVTRDEKPSAKNLDQSLGDEKVTKANMSSDKDSTMTISSNGQNRSHRVTRSITGNLKPKQPFEHEERQPVQSAKSKESNKKQSRLKKSKSSETDNKDKKLKEELFTDEEISSGNDDEGSEIHEYDSDYSPEDDPDRPWCICRKPHGNKFMICCDGCEEWFHGKCVGITMEQGRQMEELGQEYVCNKCIEKKAKEQEMMKKAKELAKSIVKNKNDITTEETHKKAREKQKNSTTSVVADADSSVKLNVQSQTPTQSDEVKIKKAKEPPGFKIPKKVRTTPTPVSHVTAQVSRKCIIDGCSRNAFEGAVYCSRGCIERHAAQAMKIFSSSGSGKKLYTSEGNRVSMIEKSSGRLVAGMTAPVVTKLAEWILKNPSFQVLFSGNSPTNHPSSSSNSKASESKQKKEVGKKSEEDTVRSNVRRMMKDILLERKKESSDINISGEEIVKLVRKIEEDMFKAFKDTSHRYKAKYRTLMFNLKDPRNKVLYKRVLNGDIPSEKLISMTSDELATKELAQWREQETKHMIDMIKKEFEGENTNKSRLLKKTHKGEVDIDGDEDLSTLVSTDIKDIEEKKPKEKVEEKVELPLLDTTEEHRSHLFDLNCKICTGKMAPPGEIVATSPTRTNAPIQAAAESSVPSPPRNEELSSYNEPLSPVIHTTPSVSTDVSQKPKIETSIWKGSVTMPSVAKFGSNAFLVSGSLDNLDQVLPDMLQVAGRIAYKQVWDYVKQCRSSSSRELCVIRFVASPDEEKISYVSLYSYFHSRKRCGVVGNCHSAVKDMYLVPLASHEPVPTLLLPFNGPGMPEPRPHMLLGLLVMNKNVPVKRSRSASDRSSTKSESIEPPSKRSTAGDVTVKTNKKPSDSPVDEIEDIVFHYHHTHGNKQGKSTKSGKAGKTSSGAGKNPTMPPMISALLKIQEQEKRLRELQKQSELLEKELAPTVNVSMSKVTTGSMGTSGSKIQASQKVPSLPPSVPPSLNIMSPVQLGNLASVLGVQKDAVSVPDNKPKQAGVLAKAGVNLGFPAVIGQTSVSSQLDSHRTKIAASPNVVSSVLDTSVPTIGTQGPSSAPLSKEEEPYDPETADSEDMPYDPEDMDTIDISLDEAPSPEKTTAMSSRTEATAMNTSVEGVYVTEQANVIHGVQVTENLNQNILQNALAIGALLKAAGKDSAQTKHVTTPPQPSIPKELEEKVQALLKSENTGVIQQFKGDPRVNRPEVRGSNVETREAYNFSRDLSTKEGEYPNRRGEEAKFYSSRFSLNASRRDEDDDHRRGGSHRGYNRDMRDRWDSEQDYHRDYRSRDNRGYRGDPRRWEDDRRRYDDQERNRDRNWRR
ncbi:death-inducer obliterator 1-like isoform X2 [Xenia sp. Carnegie-2017]|uniref:death-inducer obliterator 1-like isoform X2 n=1 Tax=Xenia sp. Carnegie-2017 TaxID=2897299 RepID=UPI001F047742|nr:death-inducer obliterator 1-like isoform X2 [Xenia sp. Carnegie-2017]